MSAVAQFERNMGMQVIILLGVGLSTIVVMCVFGLITKTPYIIVFSLAISSLLILVFSSINISCMINGSCQLWAWFVTMTTILSLIVIYARAMRLVDLFSK